MPRVLGVWEGEGGGGRLGGGAAGEEFGDNLGPGEHIRSSSGGDGSSSSSSSNNNNTTRGAAPVVAVGDGEVRQVISGVSLDALSKIGYARAEKQGRRESSSAFTCLGVLSHAARVAVRHQLVVHEQGAVPAVERRESQCGA